MERFGAPDPFLPESLWSRWTRWRIALWRTGSQTLSVSITAWAASCLFTAGYFHMFSPVTVIANLFAVPVAFLLLALGVASVATAPWLPQAAICFNHSAWAGAKLLLAGVSLFHGIPGSHYYVQIPPEPNPPPFRATVFDVGEGSAIHLQSEGKNWLIDGGSLFQYRSILLPALRSRGVNHLDGWILSHGDSAHMGAAIETLTDFDPRKIFDLAQPDRSPTRRKFLQVLQEQRIVPHQLARDAVVSISPLTWCEVLHPEATLRKDRADDLAAVLRIHHRNFTLLFLGDSGFATEQELLLRPDRLAATCIVKDWHTSDFSTATSILQKSNPKVLILGKPHSKKGIESATYLDSWARENSDLRVLRQEITGAVTIEIDREGHQKFQPFLPRVESRKPRD
jgi:beta-lactamase superfamily II metal-dependent hydrolase